MGAALPSPFVCPLTKEPLQVFAHPDGALHLGVRGRSHRFAIDSRGFLDFTRENLSEEALDLWRTSARESFRGNHNTARAATALDHYDRLILRLAKASRRHDQRKIDRDFYNHFFQEKDRVQFSCDYRNVLRRHELLRHLPHTRPLRLIDLGCGTGHVLGALTGKNIDLYGMEYAPLALGRCALSAPDAWLFCGDMTNLPLETGYFDVVVSLEVCEHIEHDVSAMEEAYRILRPRGVFLMSVPGNRHSEIYWKLIGHYRHYTQPKLTQILREVGFSDIQPLRHYPNFHRCYSLAWPWLSAMEQILGKIHGRSIYTLRVGRAKLYDRLVRAMVPAIRHDRSASRNRLGDSTFVRATK